MRFTGYSDNHYMMRKLAALCLLIPLLSLTACFNSGDPQAPEQPSAPTTASPSQQVAQNQATNPSIDSQIQDLNQHNGNINPEDQQKLNNNPLVPGAFKQ